MRFGDIVQCCLLVVFSDFFDSGEVVFEKIEVWGIEGKKSGAPSAAAPTKHNGGRPQGESLISSWSDDCCGDLLLIDAVISPVPATWEKVAGTFPEHSLDSATKNSGCAYRELSPYSIASHPFQ
jgi:hypothetical protein